MTAASQHPTGRRKRLPRRLGCLTALGIALTACATPAPGANPYLGWMEASSPKNLEVERAQYRHTIHFATDSAELTAMEQERLLTFLQTVAPTAAGHDDRRGACRRARHRPLQSRAGLAADHQRGATSCASMASMASRCIAAAFGERVPAAEGSDPAAWQQNRRVELVLERHLVAAAALPGLEPRERPRLLEPAGQQLRLRHADQSGPDDRQSQRSRARPQAGAGQRHPRRRGHRALPDGRRWSNFRKRSSETNGHRDCNRRALGRRFAARGVSRLLRRLRDLCRRRSGGRRDDAAACLDPRRRGQGGGQVSRASIARRACC